MDYPTRFREGEHRAVRLGRTLRLIAGVHELDEDLMARIGRGYLERDEPAARLADAIRSRAGSPGKVTMTQFDHALEYGAPADAPDVLCDFIAAAEEVPEWVDFDLVEEGAAFSRRLGRNAADVLTQLSLIGGYRFGGPSDLLVATGGLTGDTTRRRLAETQNWATSVTRPGSMRPHEEGWRLTVHVRLLHAMVNAAFESRWDVGRWGLPINQTDVAATLGLFDGTVLLGARALGVRITPRQSRAYMHLWRWVGHLLGVPPDFLVDRERDRQRINYHLLRAQAGVTDAGPRLANAVLEIQRTRRYGWGRLDPVRARLERERLLSMLTVFLGPASMRELELPLRPPWALAYVVPLNLVRYQVLARTRSGNRILEAWGARTRERILASYFLDEARGVAPLSA